MQIQYETPVSDIKKPTSVTHEGKTFMLAPAAAGGLDVLAQDGKTLLGEITINHPLGTVKRDGQRVATWSYIDSKASYCTIPNGEQPLGENPIIYLLQELAKH